jgi:rod shape-determining protein MreC
MLRYLKEYRFYITLFFFVLIPVVQLDIANRSPREHAPADRAILAVTAPIQRLISWTLDQLVSGFQNYLYLLDTRATNNALTQENRRLQNVIAGLREAQLENQRLRRLLDFQETLKRETVVARVIARDVSTEFRAIRINRGERSGIRKNMAVITNEGIVGRVLRTTPGTADVVTILDLLMAVDSTVERSRARGIVEGKTDELCHLKFALRTDDIEPGDTLITSGLGGIFPRGVPVGTVARVERKPFGISQDVDVRPSVDFSKLEEVLVVLSSETEAPAALQPVAPAKPEPGARPKAPSAAPTPAPRSENSP